jgi:hypothetical protein
VEEENERRERRKRMKEFTWCKELRTASTQSEMVKIPSSNPTGAKMF